MRRYITVRLFFCLSVLVYLNFAIYSSFAADAYACPQGQHEYVSEILNSNTEYEEGQVENTCIHCGYSYIETLPSTGHTFGEWEVIELPTDTKTGLESRICIGCKREETRVVPVLKIDLTAPPEDPVSPDTPWEPNAMDYLFTGGISGIWVYTLLMLWYNGLVINWDKRERRKRQNRKRG